MSAGWAEAASRLPGQMCSALSRLAAWTGGASAWAAAVLASTGKPRGPVPPASPGGLGVEPWVPPGSLGGDGASVSGPFPPAFPPLAAGTLSQAGHHPRAFWKEGLGDWPGLGTHTQPHGHTHSLTQGHMGTHTTHSHIYSYTHTQSHAVTHITQCRSPADICCPYQAQALGSPIPIQPYLSTPMPPDPFVVPPVPWACHISQLPPMGWATAPESLPCLAPADTLLCALSLQDCLLPSPFPCPHPPMLAPSTLSPTPHRIWKHKRVVGRRGPASEESGKVWGRAGREAQRHCSQDKSHRDT